MAEWDAWGPNEKLGGKKVEQDAWGPSVRLGGINGIVNYMDDWDCFCYDFSLDVL